jgi:hypothetical protein
MAFFTLKGALAFSQDDVTLVQNTEHCKDNCVLEFDVVQRDADKSMGLTTNKIDYKVIDLKSQAKPTTTVQWMKHYWTTSTPVYGLVEHSFDCKDLLSVKDLKEAKDGIVECYSEVYDERNDTNVKTVLWSGIAKDVKGSVILYDVSEVVSSTVENHEEWLGQTDKLQNLKIYVDGTVFNANFDSKYSSTVWKSGEKHRVKVTGGLKNFNEAIDIIPSMFGIDITKYAVWNSSLYNISATPNMSGVVVNNSDAILYLSIFKPSVNCSRGSKTHIWHLDELTGTNIIDYCANKNLTATTSPTLGSYGMRDLNYSVVFSGTQTLLGSSTDMTAENGQNFTILVWVKPNNDGVWRAIYSDFAYDSNLFKGVRIAQSADKKLVFSTINGAGVDDYASNSALTDNTWYMLTFVSDTTANTKSIYINGVLDASKSWTTAVTYSTASCKSISGNSGSTACGSMGNFYKGTIDEVAVIHRYAMNASEIQSEYYKNLRTSEMNCSFDGSDMEVYRDDTDELLSWVAIPNATGASYLGRNVTGQLDFLHWDAIRVLNFTMNGTNSTPIRVSCNGTNTSSKNNDVNSDLVGMWAFEPSMITSGQLKDWSGNGNTLTATGATYWQNSSCIKGNGQTSLGCYDFDGTDDKLVLSDTSYLNSASALSVFAWTKIDSQNDWEDVVSKWGDAWVITVDSTSHNWSAFIYTASANVQIITNKPYNTTGWHHVGFTYDGDTAIFYYDGVNVKNDTSVGGAIDSSAVPIIVGLDNNNNGDWDGQIDDVRIYNRSLSASEVLGLYNEPAHVGENYWTNALVGTPNVAPSVATPSWATTGGFTSGARIYGQVVDWVNASCSDADAGDLDNCTIRITDPDGVVVVNGVAMTNSSGNATFGNFTYTSDWTLNKAGVWTINVTADDGTVTASNSTTITVATNTPTTVDGYYGFTSGGIITEDAIGTYVNAYDFDLLELTDNITSYSSNFATIKSRINASYNTNIADGINLILDCNCSDQSNVSTYITSISADFDDLLLGNYRATVRYVSLEFLNVSYTAEEADDCFNNISEAIVDATDNQFIIYSKGYASSGLDTAYIQNTSILYNEEVTQSAFINWEAGTSRNTSYLNRVYDVTSQNSTLLAMSKSLQDNAYKILRSTLNETTTIVNTSVAELDNFDVLVFNNESSAWNDVSITIKSGSGKDVYDTTNDVIVEMDTDLTFSVDVPAYNVSYLQLDDFDHFQLTTSSEGTLYKATSGGAQNFSWHDNSRDGANQVTATTGRRVYLWNPNCVTDRTGMNYYGLLSDSYIQNWSHVPFVVIADTTDAEVDAVSSQTSFGGYNSVANYDAGNATFVSGEQATLDTWLAINNTFAFEFLNGLDAATITNATDFSVKLKLIVDDIRIANSPVKAYLNTYTYPEEYALFGDVAYIESLPLRWNGDNATSVNNYSWADDSWARGKSDFYESHDVEAVAVMFNNITASTPYQIMNMSIIVDAFYYAMVLGIDNVVVGDPTFNYAIDLFLPDVGEDLSNTYSTDDGVTYYRAYSNGIVYFNTSSKHGWQDRGATFNNLTLWVNLYDNTAQTYYVLVSDGLGTQYNYTVVTAGDGWSYDWHAITLNSSNEYSTCRWMVDIYSPTDGYVGLDQSGATYQGTRSWFTVNSGSSWTNEPENNHYMLSLDVDESYQSSLASFAGVNQSETTSGRKKNVTLSGDSSFALPVWSLPFTVTATQFFNLTYWNGTDYVLLYPQNTATCDSDNPTLNTTSIGGEDFKSCYEVSGSTYTLRVVPPHLSDQVFQANFNNVPVLSSLQLLPSPLYASTDANMSGTYSDPDGDFGTVYAQWYINGTANQSSSVAVNNGSSFNFTLNSSFFAKGDNVTCEVWAGDGSENTSKTNTSSTVSNSAPTMTVLHMTDNSVTNNATPYFEISYADADGDLLNATLFINGTAYGNRTGFSAGTYNITANASLSANTYYSWLVNVTDGSSNTTMTARNLYYATYFTVNESIFSTTVVGEQNYSESISYSEYHTVYTYKAYVNHTNASIVDYVIGSIPVVYDFNTSRLSQWSNRDQNKDIVQFDGNTSGVTKQTNSSVTEINASSTEGEHYFEFIYYVRKSPEGSPSPGGPSVVYTSETAEEKAEAGSQSNLKITLFGAKRYYGSNEAIKFNVISPNEAQAMSATVVKNGLSENVDLKRLNSTWFLFSYNEAGREMPGSYNVTFTSTGQTSDTYEFVMGGNAALNLVKNVSDKYDKDYRYVVAGIFGIAVLIIVLVSLIFASISDDKKKGGK